MDKYEKLYNEALERFKSFKEKYYTKDTNLGDVIFDKNGEMQKDFNGIFPELCDSEDERIRKWILEKVQEYADSGIPCSNEIQMANKTIAWIEKQKEQKPAEWSEFDEDKQWLSEVYFAIDHSMYSEVERQAMKEYIDYLRCQSQSKQEWSEEEERIIAALTKALIGSDSAEKIMLFDGVTIEMVSDWLKSLRPQPKRDGSDDYNKGYIKGRADTLEEFADMSSWKPSEEQMEALRVTIDFMPDTFKPRCTLITLQNGLEKLMSL